MEIGILFKFSQNPSTIKYHASVEPSLRIYIYIKYILILSSHCRFRNTKLSHSFRLSPIKILWSRL